LVTFTPPEIAPEKLPTLPEAATEIAKFPIPDIFPEPNTPTLELRFKVRLLGPDKLAFIVIAPACKPVLVSEEICGADHVTVIGLVKLLDQPLPLLDKPDVFVNSKYSVELPEKLKVSVFVPPLEVVDVAL
jgi:hypothetical protein